jgi:predicted nucleic acid-binding protein
MTVLIDTNILIDFLADRKPFSDSAGKLFSLSLSKRLKLFIAAISYNNIYYILRQSLGQKETLKLLNSIFEMTEVINLSKPIIQSSLTSDFKDFEDALQYFSALSNPKIQCIITRNTKDFKLSGLPVMTPDEFIARLEYDNE